MVEVAEQGVNDDIGLGNLSAVAVMVVQTMVAGVQKRGRRVFGQVAGNFTDFVCRDITDCRSFVRRKVTVGGPEFLKAKHIFLHEVFVIQVFTDQRVGNSEKKGKIGTGADRNPLVGDFGQFTQARVYDDDLATLCAGFGQLFHCRRNDRAAIVATGKQHVFATANVDRQLIGDHLVPGIGLGGETGGIVGDEIRRTDFIEKHSTISVFTAMRHPGHRVAGVLVNDRGKFFGDFLERLVPGDRLKFSVGAAFHRLSHSVLIVEVCGDAMSSGAQSAVILHCNRMAFDFPESPVFYIGEHRTTG